MIVAIIEETDLATLNPRLAEEWHPTKNGQLRPYDVTAGSQKKIWWICGKGHEWLAKVNDREKSGCPYCSGKRVIPGETDLATLNPRLAEEWHPTKNGQLRPYNVSEGSDKKIWWICKKGHEWQSKVDDRKKGGCPYCSGRRVIPGETDLATLNPRLAEEWHPTKNGKLQPRDVSVGSDKDVWWICGKGHEWQAKINNRKRSGCPYCSGRRVILGETDLATLNPRLAEEWHPTKNGQLRPCDVTAGSQKKIWWICGKGHEWLAKVNDRKKSGCPYCSGKRVIPGETDLVTLNPRLAEEWHPTKNGQLQPCDVSEWSSKKIWWKCKNGHEWQANVANRSKNSCPYCSGKRVISGENDLLTTHTLIAAEWDYEKNLGTMPNNISAYSRKKVWWKCKNGHEWQAKVANRTKRGGCRCPFCSKKLPIKGENDLETLYPELAKEWNYARNYKLLPSDFFPGSGKCVSWICEKGHEYRTKICDRTRGNGCRKCWEERKR